MSDLKSTISNRIVTPNVNTAFNTPSTGLVKKAYEDENVCDITYFDSNGSPKNKNKSQSLKKLEIINLFKSVWPILKLYLYVEG